MRRITILVAAYTVIWWILSGSNLNSWILGIPAILVATWFSYRAHEAVSSKISVKACFIYLVFFLRESFRGGFDVAKRSFSHQMRLSPKVIPYHTDLRAPWQRVLLCATTNLLPGTLTIRIEKNCLFIHTLDSSDNPMDGVSQCENLIHKLSKNYSD